MATSKHNFKCVLFWEINMNTKLSLVSSAVFAALSFAISTPLFAETGDQVTRKKDRETITVSGSRIEQGLDDVSGSVTIIDAEEVEAIQATDIGDLLDYTPGVDVVKDARYGIKSISIRGLEGNYVKVKVDNVSAPAEFESGQSLIASSRIDLDIDMIKSVEITRGPASTSQGSDAIGGLVLFQTKDASDFLGNEEGFGGHVKFLYDSSTSGFRQSYALAHRAGDFDSVVSFSAADFDGVEDYSELYKENSKPKSVLLKTTYNINDTDSIRFSLDWNETKNTSDPENEQDEKYEYTNDTSERLRYGLRYLAQFQSPVLDSAAIQLDWQEKEQSSQTYRYVSPGRSTSTPRGELKDYSYSEEGYTFDAQFNKDIKTGDIGHKMAYGVTYSDIDYKNVNVTHFDSNLDGSYGDSSLLYFYIPHSEANTLGVYFLDEISFMNGDLLVTPGVRYDKFEQDPYNADPSQGDIPHTGFSPTNEYEAFSDSEVTFKLGTVYKLNAQTRIFGQYSQGFKAPDFNQLYYSYANDRVGYKYKPNPDLKSEFSDSYELGVRYSGEITSFEVSTFYSDFKDFINTSSDFTDPSYPYGIYYRENLDEAEIKGVELSSNIEGDSILPGTWATLAVSYADGEDGEGNTLDSVAPWSGSLSLNYENPSNFWGTSLRLKHYSGADAADFEQDTQVTPGSASIIDLTAFINVTDELTLRAGVYNLTDKKWYRWGTISGLAPGADMDQYAEPKRSFSLTAKYNF